MDVTVYPSPIKGTVIIPPSKSDTQRALLCAALCKGVSYIQHVGKSDDEQNMLNVIEALGAKIDCIDEVTNTYSIDGTFTFSGKKTINIGESGLGIRLLTSILATQSSAYTINGKGTLLKRPMNFFSDVFKQTDVLFESSNNYLPLKVKGPIATTNLVVDGSESSQYISGLLMALPLLKKEVTLSVTNLKSVPYVQMTIQTLASFGIDIQADFNENISVFKIKAEQTYKASNYIIEGDWSSASYWITAKMLGANLIIEGLKSDSLQADKKIMELVVTSDSEIDSWLTNNQVKDNNAFTFDATHCPDLFPALTTLAHFKNGTTTITGVKRLKHKESSRGDVLEKEFNSIGGNINQEENQLVINGTGELKGGLTHSNHDHRIAMTLGIAGLFTEECVVIKQANVVSKSYPTFWEELSRLIVL